MHLTRWPGETSMDSMSLLLHYTVASEHLVAPSQPGSGSKADGGSPARALKPRRFAGSSEGMEENSTLV